MDNPLKAIIFDFGGVLVRTFDAGFRRNWEKEHGLPAGETDRLVFGSEESRKAQIGEWSTDQLWEFIAEKLELDEDELTEFKIVYFAGDKLDTDLIEYLARLRPRFRLGLLSNAWSGVRKDFTTTYPIADSFDAMVISSEVGILKPDERIYQLILSKLGVAPQESLFVDDFAANIEAARKLGMNVIHFRDPIAVQHRLEEITGVPWNEGCA